MEISRSHDLPAPPAEVAAFVSDLSRWPDWFALHKGWSGDIPTEARVGTKFKHKVRVLGVPGDVSWEVTDLQEPSRFALKGKGPSRTSVGIDFVIAAREDGSTIAFTASMGGLVLRPVEGMLRDWLDVRIDRTLAALERELGQRAAPSSAGRQNLRR